MNYALNTNDGPILDSTRPATNSMVETENGKINILLVDDKQESLLALEAMLEGLGQNLVLARSGAEALKHLLSMEFALILLDVYMPDMDGFEVAEMIRQRQSLQYVPIIFLTAVRDYEHQIFKGYEAGAVDYMVKPVVPEILRAKVSVFIELAKRRNQLRRQGELLRQSEAKLYQSQKLESLGQLVAGVAHEVNNPLAFIITNLNVLKDYVETVKSFMTTTSLSYKDSKELEDICEDIGPLLTETIDGTDRIRDIIQGLKNFARTDDSKQQEANINDLIETTLKVLQNELKYKCKVTKDLSNTPHIQCYPGLLNQMFMNLFLNAAQAIKEKGDIHISTGSDGSYTIIRVSDTGEGIRDENMPKLFTPFFTTKPQGKGLGLGLSTIYGIVQKHKGTIEVASKVNEGTTFTIRLPISQQ